MSKPMTIKQWRNVWLISTVAFFLLAGMFFIDNLFIDEIEKDRIREYYRSADRYAIGLDNGIQLSLTPKELCTKLTDGSFQWDDLSPNMTLMMEFCEE